MCPLFGLCSIWSIFGLGISGFSFHRVDIPRLSRWIVARPSCESHFSKIIFARQVEEKTAIFGTAFLQPSSLRWQGAEMEPGGGGATVSHCDCPSLQTKPRVRLRAFPTIATVLCYRKCVVCLNVFIVHRDHVLSTESLLSQFRKRGDACIWCCFLRPLFFLCLQIGESLSVLFRGLSLESVVLDLLSSAHRVT